MIKNIAKATTFLMALLTISTVGGTTWPIHCGQGNAPLTSAFGARDYSGYDWHAGVDIRNANDKRVDAVHDGWVDLRTTISGYGNTMFIGDDSLTYATSYAHLNSYKKQEGDNVYAGYEIAESGGNHLHFNYDTNRVYLQSTLWATTPLTPDDEHTVNPMCILPYTNQGPPGFVYFFDQPGIEFNKNDGVAGILDGNPHVYVKIKTRGKELDFNKIEIILTGTEQGGTSHNHTTLLKGGNVVDLNERTNCGTNSQTNNHIYIGVHNFNPDNQDSTQILEFRFKIDTVNWNKCMKDWTQGYPKITGTLKAWDTAGKDTVLEETLETTNDFRQILGEFALSQNYPNPFNPQTRIDYYLAENSYVRFKVFNLLGQEVNMLLDTQQRFGLHHVFWDGRDKYDNEVASGTYLYQLEAIAPSGNRKFLQRKKMTLIR